MKFAYLILSGIIIVCSFSCKKASKDIKLGNVLNIADYPLKLNAQWRYQVTDFYSNAIDTLTIKIISVNDQDTAQFFSCQLSEHGFIVDSGLYTIKQTETENQIEYVGLNPLYSYFGNFILDFPITPNSLWLGANTYDTVKVISQTSNIQILDSLYNNVFNIKRAFYLGGGYSWVQTIQIHVGEGVVEQNINLFNGGIVQKQQFDLIDYSE